MKYTEKRILNKEDREFLYILWREFHFSTKALSIQYKLSINKVKQIIKEYFSKDKYYFEI